MMKYLAGNLPNAEHDAFEEHFFECEDCFAGLEDLRALQAELAGTRARIEADAPRKVTPWRRTWAAGLAAAAAVVIGLTALLLGPWKTPMGLPTVSAQLVEMARIDPPPYTPVRLRGATDEAQRQFRKTMESYTAGSYAAAIPGLEAAAKLDPEAPNIRFFLGTCYLLSERTGDGIEALQHVVDLGDTPFLEEALLLLAMGFLGNGDIESAMQHAEMVVSLEGDYQKQALEMTNEIHRIVEIGDAPPVHTE
jgi:tetratricopeptide (TPR) repeat protein